MSEVAAGGGRLRRGRWRDLLVTAVIGAVVVSAALLPAVTASSGETVTVRGEVTLSGRPLQFFPVGFWTTTSGVVVASTTDANGRFTLDVPATLDGFAYAGATPDSQRAIITVDGQPIVRGVIGANASTSTAPVLYQGRPTGTARGLSGGSGDVRFALLPAGRIAGTSPVPASALRSVEIRRADNSVVETLQLDSSRRFRSKPLVPGQYGVVLVPKSPNLPTVVDAVVKAGATTTVAPPTPTAGATVSGVVRSTLGDVGAVPVLLEQDGDVLAATTSSDTGAWSFAGVAAGDYSVVVGRYDEPAATSAAFSDVRIPGASPSPTPTAATPSPSTSVPVATPEGAAVQPVERTADAVQPGTFDVTVPETLGEVRIATDVAAAGRIAGTVSDEAVAASADPVDVVVEELDTGRIVRATTAAASGRYSIGGLEDGEEYRVYAVTEPDDPTLARMGSTTVVADTTEALADVAIDEPALTLNGTVSGATGGTVLAGDDALFQRAGTIDESGAYAVQGLVPGAYPVVVEATGRESAQPVGVVVSASEPVVDLQQGPSPATFKGWFIASGAGVPAVVGRAVDENGDVVEFGPQTDRGEVTIEGLRPGTYEYDAESFRGTVPAEDGPWYYSPPSGTFSLSDGATTDVFAIVLRTRLH